MPQTGSSNGLDKFLHQVRDVPQTRETQAHFISRLYMLFILSRCILYCSLYAYLLVYFFIKYLMVDFLCCNLWRKILLDLCCSYRDIWLNFVYKYSVLRFLFISKSGNSRNVPGLQFGQIFHIWIRLGLIQSKAFNGPQERQNVSQKMQLTKGFSKAKTSAAPNAERPKEIQKWKDASFCIRSFSSPPFPTVTRQFTTEKRKHIPGNTNSKPVEETLRYQYVFNCP